MDKDKSLKEFERSLSKASNFKIESVEDFNECVDHVIRLVKDSFMLFQMKSFSTSLFLSIAIIEEVGKIHVGLFNTRQAEVKRDPLRDHKRKQIMGSNYTISMGDRLVNAIGMERLEEIYSMSYSGQLKDLREKSIYCDYEGDGLIIPHEYINEQFSKDILLFAIESFDDNLVGYTRHSMERSKITDKIFENLSTD
ncbi:hypothetical protein GCM10022378_09370 [Salinicoccus jeotgali]|uniref:AbiV family abortive infection protein n=1 Tax=Salinicoccus jeotgali TaxID=381634 RepID=A0ABP7EQJ2_9STAP